MTSYIIAGVKADDEQVFLQRVGELLERNDLLDQLTEGVAVSATIVDEAAFIDALQKQYKERLNIEITNPNITIDRDGRLELGGMSYDRTYWYATEEAAAKAEYRDGYGSKDEKHPFSGLNHTTDYHVRVSKDTAGIKVLYV